MQPQSQELEFNPQCYVDALRNEEYLTFLDITDAINRYYKNKFGHGVLGADEILPLIQYELSKTNIDLEDLKKLSQFQMLLGEGKDDFNIQIDLAYQNATGYQFMTLISFIPQVIAFKKVNTAGYVTNFPAINTEEDLKAFNKFQQTITKENKRLKRASSEIARELNDLSQIPKLLVPQQSIVKFYFDVYTQHKNYFDFNGQEPFHCFTDALFSIYPSLNIQNKAYLIREFHQHDRESKAQNKFSAYFYDMWNAKIDIPDRINFLKFIVGDKSTKKIFYDYLLSNYSLESLINFRNARYPLPDTIKRSFCLYVIKHINKVRTLQWKFNSKDQKEINDFETRIKESEQQTETDIEFTKTLIKQIKEMILDTKWKVGLLGLGGTYINKIKVPKHVAKIYELCCDSKSDPSNALEIYEKIKAEGHKALHHHSFFRSHETRKFYRKLDSAHIKPCELNSLSTKKKPRKKT